MAHMRVIGAALQMLLAKVKLRLRSRLYAIRAFLDLRVQPTKMTLALQLVLSSSEVRASDHGGSWVRIPSGAQIIFVSSYG